MARGTVARGRDRTHSRTRRVDTLRASALGHQPVAGSRTQSWFQLADVGDAIDNGEAIDPSMSFPTAALRVG